MALSSVNFKSFDAIKLKFVNSAKNVNAVLMFERTFVPRWYASPTRQAVRPRRDRAQSGRGKAPPPRCTTTLAPQPL